MAGFSGIDYCRGSQDRVLMSSAIRTPGSRYGFEGRVDDMGDARRAALPFEGSADLPEGA
jgi:hypothetical protein